MGCFKKLRVHNFEQPFKPELDNASGGKLKTTIIKETKINNHFTHAPKKAYKKEENENYLLNKVATWASKANIPRWGFIAGLIGDIVSSLIIVFQTAQNSTINYSQKGGIISNEISKFISNLSVMGSYELLVAIIKNLLINKLPYKSLNALSQVIGMFGSYILNDLIMPFFKSWLAASVATSWLPNYLISALNHKK